jgi:Flp pilus assembly protein TadG
VDKKIKRDRNRGQGMVEFAIVFPLLLLLLFGIFEFGRIMFIYSAVVTASRDAARYGAAILDTGGGISQYEDCAGIRETAKNIGKYAGISDADISIQYSNESGIYSASCPPSQEVTAADIISISISTSVIPVTPIGNFSAIPLNSSTSRTILKNVELGSSGTGSGSVSGALSDVNFKTTSQSAEETLGTISVVLELNKPATDLVTIPFSVTGTAFPGASADYLITASPITISPGASTAIIYISLNNDGIAEGNETLILGIDSPINATRGPQHIHTITISDPPDISFSTVSSVHNESDPMTAIMVELSKGSSQDVSVSFSMTGTATWGASSDYVTFLTTLTIPSGTLSSMVTFTVNNDTTDENNEVAIITLDSPVNGMIGANHAHSATILDDDNPPMVSFFVPNQVVSEEIGIFATSLTLSEISGKDIYIPYTLSGTTIPEDYLIHEPSPLYLPAGSSTTDINMDILEGDGLEEDETLIITLGEPVNAFLGAPATQTIVITESSDEPTVSFASSSQSTLEGDLVLDIIVQLSNAWSVPIVIPFSVSGTAQAGSLNDYSMTTSPLIIPVGWTQGTIQLAINDDLIDEDTEDVVVTMGEIQNGTPGALTTHQVLILDNDSPPEVYISTNNKSVGEDAGTVSVSVDLTAPSVHDVSVPLNLSGTAAQGSDYSISTTNLIIPSGAISGTFQITVTDDNQYDPNEQVIVSLGTPTNADLGSPSSYTLVIEDNELPPCDVGIHLLTIGTDSINLSIVNEGEDVIYTGGSVSWNESNVNQPRINQINFAGNVVYSGSDKPAFFSFAAAEGFSSLATESVQFQFDGTLGSGTNVIVSNFQNVVDGTGCSVTETFATY